MPLLPHPPATLVALRYHLPRTGHQPSVPVSSSSWLVEVAELWLYLYILEVSFSSSSRLVDEVPFLKALSGCCSLEKVQFLMYNNEGITLFSLSKEVIKENTFSYSFP